VEEDVQCGGGPQAMRMCIINQDYRGIGGKQIHTML
jgi:hypothetical protein